MAIITSLVTTLLASAAASPNSRRRAQAAEPTPWWDNAMSTCLSNNQATGEEKLVISQTMRTRAVVTYTGFAGGAPKMLWLTDESGTIIQLRVSSNMSNTFDFPLVEAYPLSLGAHSCPPAPVTTIRAWDGLYFDATTVCCTSATGSADAKYQPTITVSNSDWNRQRVDVRADQKAPVLNWLRDDSGNLLRVDNGSYTENGGAYTSPDVKLTGITWSIEACAAVSTDESPQIYNPLCSTYSFLERIVSSLESAGTTETTYAALAPGAEAATKKFSGSRSAPIVTFLTTDSTGQSSGDHCVSYAKAGSQTATPFAYGTTADLSVELTDARLAGSDDLYLYESCRVVISVGSSTPIRNNAGRMSRVKLSVAALKQEASVAQLAAFSSAGSGTLAVMAGRCGVAYGVGDWVISSNSSLGTRENCTCELPDGEVEPSWQCTAIERSFFTYLSSGQVAMLAILLTFLLIVLLLVCMYAMRKRTVKSQRYNTQVALPRANDYA